MSTKSEQTAAYKRGLEGKNGPKFGLNPVLPDREERKAYRQGVEDRQTIREEKKREQMRDDLRDS